MVPENATDNIPTWLSSNKEIASVRRGIVKGIAPGEVTITAQIGDIKATCVVKVVLPDGIEQATESELLKIYDITGRPVRLDATSTDGLEQGIYIINGHKTMIK